MGVIPQDRRLRRIILSVLTGSLLIAILALLPLAVARPLSTITSSLSAFAAYDPATYGIPYQIGGFTVLAIKTSENTACVSSGMMTVKIQSSQPDVQNVLANSGDTRIVYETLQQIPSLNNIKFTLEVIGPVPWNPQRFMSEIAKWNEATKNGCLTLGPAQVIPLTPTPDPFAPYDPATFGIPEILAGYRILAIKSAENTACVPDNFQDVLVQAVDPMPDNPLVAQGNGDVIFELKKLNPNVRWGLGGMMPVPFDRAGFVSQQDNWNRAMENGCFQFGGPIADVAPDLSVAYDPASFGIPEIVAGYRIVAVHTLENTACMPDGEMRVTIQAVEPSADNPMVAASGGDIVFELKKFYPDVQWSLTYIMPGSFAREQAVAAMQEWNGAMENGCFQFGGPIVLATPDSFAPYDPATFGLPEIVAGYRIVTVQTSGNTPCMAVNQIRLTIQAVDPSPDNPMVARDGGDIIFEVSQLHPDIDWQLQYIMPGAFDREQFVASMQEWNKNGCTKLGGPEFTLTPGYTPTPDR